MAATCVSCKPPYFCARAARNCLRLPFQPSVQNQKIAALLNAGLSDPKRVLDVSEQALLEGFDYPVRRLGSLAMLTEEMLTEDLGGHEAWRYGMRRAGHTSTTSIQQDVKGIVWLSSSLHNQTVRNGWMSRPEVLNVSGLR